MDFYERNQRLSKAVRCGGMLYLSGMTDSSADTPLEQARLVLRKVEEYLRKYGSDKKHIASVTIYLKDMKFFNDFNTAWNEWVVDGYQPARACVQAQLARDALLVEVSAIAQVAEA